MCAGMEFDPNALFPHAPSTIELHQPIHGAQLIPGTFELSWKWPEEVPFSERDSCVLGMADEPMRVNGATLENPTRIFWMWAPALQISGTAAHELDGNGLLQVREGDGTRVSYGSGQFRVDLDQPLGLITQKTYYWAVWCLTVTTGRIRASSPVWSFQYLSAAST